MEKALTSDERRQKLISLLKETSVPLSGTALGQATGVSRQVVVQDIALLRTSGVPVIATARGYMIQQNEECVRLIKVCHTNEQIEEELNAIVDLGGTVHDVLVNHKTYGKMVASMSIKSRRDVREFLEAMNSGKSTPLSNITSGYHFHHISAESEHILDEIEQVLRQKNFLAQKMDYELELV